MDFVNNDNIFTESALVDSVLYKSFNTNAELTGTILSALKDSIIIDRNYIQEQLMQIKRTRISPLAEAVLQAYENENIVLLYSHIKKVPQALPFFATKIQGKIKVFIFVNNYGTISKSSVNSEDKFLSITMKDLYVLMEGAYTAYKYAISPVQITKNLGLMKLSTNIYTSMVARIFNKEYAISMDQDLYDKVNFCIGYFFTKYVWMSHNDDINFSYALNPIRSGRGINIADFTILANEMNEKGITTISSLIEFLHDLSPRLKSLNFRYFIQCYINTYKPGAMFSLECLPYFLYTIEASMIGSFIVNQPMIADITKNIKGMNTFYPELTKAIL
jgi:hypothetical protein